MWCFRKYISVIIQHKMFVGTGLISVDLSRWEVFVYLFSQELFSAVFLLSQSRKERVSKYQSNTHLNRNSVYSNWKMDLEVKVSFGERTAYFALMDIDFTLKQFMFHLLCLMNYGHIFHVNILLSWCLTQNFQMKFWVDMSLFKGNFVKHEVC